MSTVSHLSWIRTGILAVTLGMLSPAVAAPPPTAPAVAVPPADVAAQQERAVVEHVLSRMTFGPTPGQVEAVLAEGWQAWARRQLQPGMIDDGAVKAHVAETWPTLRMSPTEVLLRYRPPYAENPPTLEMIRERQRLEGKLRAQLPSSVLYRAVYSERQFNEVICEFWRNHFNVNQMKDDVGMFANSYEEGVIRAHAFGKFENMLAASAKHPAMLIYLDNYVSQAPLSEGEERKLERLAGRDSRAGRALARHRGLNENYARELLELHTFGVDKGYTQRDVTELARVLTGWTIGWTDKYGRLVDGPGKYEPGEVTYGFHFRKDVHDADEKVLLGRPFGRRGYEGDGDLVLHGLGTHANTAYFISKKLCRHFVNDNPPEPLVRRVAGVFMQTGGDLPRVYAAVILSPEFIDEANRRAKFKTPMEFVVSTLRATGAEIEYDRETLHAIGRMGQPIYRQEDPTGYADAAEAWLDPGVLVYRWSYALKLAAGKVEGVDLDADALGLNELKGKSPEAMLAALEPRIVPAGLSVRTRSAVLTELKRDADAKLALGLLLGSPEFQQQ